MHYATALSDHQRFYWHSKWAHKQRITLRHQQLERFYNYDLFINTQPTQSCLNAEVKFHAQKIKKQNMISPTKFSWLNFSFEKEANKNNSRTSLVLLTWAAIDFNRLLTIYRLLFQYAKIYNSFVEYFHLDDLLYGNVWWFFLKFNCVYKMAN